MRYILTIFFLFWGVSVVSSGVPAVSMEQADSVYRKKNYKAAAELYEKIIKEKGVSVTAYYNLGNAYFRQKEYAKAILNYERALRLAPSDEDVRFNLAVARSKASVPQVNASEMFFITWIDRFIRNRSANVWGLWALGFLLFSLGSLLVYIFFHRTWLRKTGFAAMSFFLLGLVFCTVAAALQKNRFHNEERAVVMESSSFVTDAPKAKKRMLVSGQAVRVIDKSPDGRWQVQLSGENTVGWIDGKALQSVHVVIN